MPETSTMIVIPLWLTDSSRKQPNSATTAHWTHGQLRRNWITNWRTSAKALER